MIGLQVLSMAMAFVGAAWSFENWRGRRLKQDSAFWPTTKGEIVWSDIVVETGRDETGRTATRYGAAIRYRYLLGGTRFESTRITWRDGQKTTRAAAQRKLLARYPVGRAVNVHYDPRRPAMAVLETENRTVRRLGRLTATALLVFGPIGMIAATLTA
ncbi:MAG: hypothetical protein JWN71_4976 [Xanthobacteraceae bacterium]|jgi:hypothetical protein|nr:hypothetical protein [Xanthobacteraceae bacterium]